MPKVILVIGSCGLDRLLTVNKYPAPDAKVRTTSYHEVGGGNAANTASAMGLLTDAEFLKQQDIQIRILTKVGDDNVGKQLLDELEKSNVDVSSPLCIRAPPGSTTAFTTVVVSDSEHTRTCIHTPGTCGELTLEDTKAINLDKLFENVVHFHSDSRHTDVSLYLAKEAQSRGLPVSCDCEKDRKTKALDELIQISDILFTNSNYLGPYLCRLERELAESQSLEVNGQLEAPEEVTESMLSLDTTEVLVKSLTPSSFLNRWFPKESPREVVVTQ